MSLSWRTCFRFAVFLKPRPPRCCGELMLLLLKEMLGLVCSRTWIPQFPSNLSITKRSRQLEFLTSSCRNQSSRCLFDLMLTMLFDPSQTLLNLLPLRLSTRLQDSGVKADSRLWWPPSKQVSSENVL